MTTRSRHPGHVLATAPAQATAAVAFTTPTAAPPSLHHTLGNRFLQRLVVGPEGDRYEREADRIARQVVRSAGPSARAGRPGHPGPLDDATRTRMETAFGADFTGVRVRTGPPVDHLSNILGARAFTVGSDVFLRHGEYRPGTRAGDELLAHELTHTLQQRRMPASRA